MFPPSGFLSVFLGVLDLAPRRLIVGGPAGMGDTQNDPKVTEISQLFEILYTMTCVPVY